MKSTKTFNYSRGFQDALDEIARVRAALLQAEPPEMENPLGLAYTARVLEQVHSHLQLYVTGTDPKLARLLLRPSEGEA